MRDGKNAVVGTALGLAIAAVIGIGGYFAVNKIKNDSAIARDTERVADTLEAGEAIKAQEFEGSVNCKVTRARRRVYSEGKYGTVYGFTKKIELSMTCGESENSQP